MPTPTLESHVGGSRKLFHVVGTDGAGHRSNFTAFATDSAQLLYVEAADGTFTVTFNGHTTPDIPLGVKGS
jgi:hypothetical protein